MPGSTDEPQRLYAAILAAPNDDRLRRALGRYYDGIGDPRGEFLRLQLEDADKKVHGLLDGALIRRERELIDAHGREWATPVAHLVTPDPHQRSYGFHRGLVGEVTLPLDRFLDVAPELFAAAPVQHLNLTAPRTRWTELLDSPYLARLVSLGLQRMGFDDTDAGVIAAAEGLGRLRWLSLAGNPIGEAGVEALAASPHLAGLAVIDLSNNPCDPVPRPAGRDLDGRVVAIDHPMLAGVLKSRYGPLPWLDNPELPDAWPLPRDCYRPITPKLARTDAEADLFIGRRPCPCGRGKTTFRSAVVQLDGELASRYDCRCTGCPGTRRFVFRLPPQLIQPPATGMVYGGHEPSVLLDPGEWLDVAEEFARSVPADAGLAGLDAAALRAARQRLECAAAAMDEVAKFVPARAAEVPAWAFTTRAGRAIWEREPGRFRLVRLQAVREAYARAAAAIGA